MKHTPTFRRRRRNTKSVLLLPDLEHAQSAVLNSLTSADAKRGYRHAIDEFVDWYCSEPRLAFNRIVVLRYRSHLESRQLAPGTINLRLGAVRRLAYEAADCGLLSADLAAGIRRVKGVKKLGMRLGNWLTAEQGHALWQAPDQQRLKGKRDRALLALLLACGLRRHEAVALRLDHLQQREEHWAIVDLVGKGGHVRTVPVPDWVRQELDNWLTAAGIDRGRLFRRVNKVGKIGLPRSCNRGSQAADDTCSRAPQFLSFEKTHFHSARATAKPEPSVQILSFFANGTNRRHQLLSGIRFDNITAGSTTEGLPDCFSRVELAQEEDFSAWGHSAYAAGCLKSV
jgi:integrase